MLWIRNFLCLVYYIKRGQSCLKNYAYFIVFCLPDTALRILSFYFSQWPYEVCLSSISLWEKPSIKENKEKKIPRIYRPGSEWCTSIHAALFLTLVPVYLWWPCKQRRIGNYEKPVTYMCYLHNWFRFFYPLDKYTAKLKCAFWVPTKNEQAKRERKRKKLQ